MSLYDGETALSLGNKYNKVDVKAARLWYKVALEDKDVRNKALIRLIDLERRLGRYSFAREYVHLLEDFSDLSAFYDIGKLEQNECNYLSALDNFSKALASNYSQLGSLMSLAEVYTKIGEFEIARRIYETLQYNPTYSDWSLLGLANIDMIEEDYDHGLKILENGSDSVKNDSLYVTMYITLMYLKGKINEIKGPRFDKTYTLNRFKTNNPNVLLSHLKKHESSNLVSENYFSSGGYQRAHPRSRK